MRMLSYYFIIVIKVILNQKLSSILNPTNKSLVLFFRKCMHMYPHLYSSTQTDMYTYIQDILVLYTNDPVPWYSSWL